MKKFRLNIFFFLKITAAYLSMVMCSPLVLFFYLPAFTVLPCIALIHVYVYPCMRRFTKG
ncbi:hypothetical protein K450DRAFT_225164 [Umbelopsis ramanniana AG]|uniref:Uncharacterized protein n=1 Tax=Umbelopsis ramanniana AG TaxID=1314678 RepID=A0AAD5EGM0_UMBRA|nr:uncharacterized protein K450DRAFT_225164 [Umbelopsis ramanniana AG]KAI8582859.1 hypothetical protein K450DRAFT_225164 [Umbelopsis ramanniana AG]